MTDARPFDPSALTPEDPPPFEVVNDAAEPRFFLTCDHASNAVPRHMNGLGLPAAERERHIGWDIGAADVTRRLSRILDAPAVLSGHSRLVIDCNRPIGVETSIPRVSDRTEIPGNQAVSAAEAAARADAFFWPYHNAIAERLDTILASGRVPLLVAVHSFTPEMDNFRRPWQVGLLWEYDHRVVGPLKAAFEALRPGIVIGDNEPYAIRGPSDYGIPAHGQGRGLPHVELEIRQDLIERPEGAQEWAELVGAALERVLTELQPLTIKPPL